MAEAEPEEQKSELASWGASASEFLSGAVTGRPKVFSLVALLVLVVTGIIWLVQHTERWPGGYLPWMLTLAASLISASCFFNFHSMRLQRNAAVQAGRKITPLHGTTGSTWRLSARLTRADAMEISIFTEVEVNLVHYLRIFVENPTNRESTMSTVTPPFGGLASNLWPIGGTGYAVQYPQQFENAPPLEPGRYGITAQALTQGSIYPQTLASASLVVDPIADEALQRLWSYYSD